MSYDIPGMVRSYEAAGDISGSYLKFVKLSGSTVAAVTVAATDPAVGVLQNKPDAAGKASSVMVTGVTRVKVADAGIAAGVRAYLSADGSISATVVAGHCVGITETACSNAGEIVSLLLKPLGAIGA